LSNKQRIPFMWCAKCAIFFCVSSRHINFFLSAWKRFNFKNS